MDLSSYVAERVMSRPRAGTMYIRAECIKYDKMYDMIIMTLAYKDLHLDTTSMESSEVGDSRPIGCTTLESVGKGGRTRHGLRQFRPQTPLA